jgi:hypothetical protein
VGDGDAVCVENAVPPRRRDTNRYETVICGIFQQKRNIKAINQSTAPSSIIIIIVASLATKTKQPANEKQAIQQLITDADAVKHHIFILAPHYTQLYCLIVWRNVLCAIVRALRAKCHDVIISVIS